MRYPSEVEMVRIPVRVLKGQIVYFYSDQPLHLQEGVAGDLLIPKYAVIDKATGKAWQEKERVELFPAGATLALGMRDDLSAGLKRFDEVSDGVYIGFRVIPVELTEPLTLVLRGTKAAVLEGGCCTSEGFEGVAISLNHAYSLLSAQYEPSRRSHTGNVFQRGFYRDDEGCWRQLDALRKKHDAQYEKKALRLK